MIRKIVFFIFITFQIAVPFRISAEGIQCEIDPTDPRIKNIIFLLKEKWNIVKTIELECDSFLEGKNEKEFKHFRFILSGNNYYYELSIPTKKGKNITDINKPTNILEELILKKSKEKSSSYYDLHLVNYYYYMGKFTVRDILLKENEKVIYYFSNNADEIKIYGDPRILFGGGIDYKIENINVPLPFYEFLERTGPYFYYEIDSYKVLLHQAEVEQLPYPQSIEFWIDKENNLVKIRSGVKYTFRYPKEIKKFEEEILKHKLDCKSLDEVYVEFNFSDFHPDYKIPLKMGKKVFEYPYKKNCEVQAQQIIDMFDKGKISIAECDITLYSLREKEPEIRSELLLTVNKIKVNEPIDEKVFIAPVPDRSAMSPEEVSQQKKEQSWYRRYTGVIFVGGCVAFTLLLMFLTRRYLGWGA